MRWTLLVAVGVGLAMAAWAAELPAPEGMGREAVVPVDYGAGTTLLSGFCNLYNLHVLPEPDGTYVGFFFGWAAEPCNPGFSGCDAIYLARAAVPEGPWRVYAGDAGWNADRPASWVPVVSAQDRPWDQWHNGDPSVVKEGDTYYLVYSSTGHNLDGVPYGQPGDRDGSILCVMAATSADGMAWTRSDEPILIHAQDLGGVSVPHGEAHLYGSYHRPTLLLEEGVWRLWFDYWAGDADGVSVGYAECRGEFLDPAAWHVIRADDTPALRQFPNPDVVRCGGLLLAFGDPPVGGTGHPWVDRMVTVAASRDGLDWLVVGHLEPPEGIPAIHVPEALAVGDRVYLYYATQRGGEPYDYMYDSIRVIPLSLDLDAIRQALEAAVGP